MWRSPLQVRHEPFHPISIRGRMAFSIVCLEAVAWKFKLNLEGLLELLWAFTTSERLDEWEADVLQLVDYEAAGSYAQRFAFEHLGEPTASLIGDLIEEVVEVGRGNLYGGYRSDFTAEPAATVADLCRELTGDAPDLTPFACSPATNDDGWGSPISEDVFRAEMSGVDRFRAKLLRRVNG